MSQQERSSWNRRYREGSHRSLEPDPFLVQAFGDYIQPLFPHGGSALDLAGGVGRHAMYLAQRNWCVVLHDISEVGLAKAKEEARAIGVDGIQYVRGDSAEFDFAPAAYDLVLVFFYLERSILPKLKQALRPGGLLVYKTYTQEQARFRGGPTHPMHLLAPGELLRAFADMHVLFYRETVQEKGVAELVALK